MVGPWSVPLGVGLPLVSVAAGQADGPWPPCRLPGLGLQGRSICFPQGVRGAIEDEEGGCRLCGKYVLNDIRA
eukprot:2424276-Pyramimonas_sp.AAC.1